MPIAVTGIKPSGTPHIGNYLGMIRPALELTRTHRALYFIADYHALTTVTDGGTLRELVHDVAATWLALGLDPERVIFYRQSDLPEVFELAWVLSCCTPKGLLNRAHAYKALVDENVGAGRSPDEGVNAGLFTYPVLMAADIILFGAHAVPVGQDQRQHVEIARGIASSFNARYGDVLTVPEALVRQDVATVPGLDGRKMSKSYENVIPIFAPPEELRRLVRRMVTDSRRPEEPKDPDSDTLFGLFRQFASPEETAAMRERYLRGGVAYSEVKDRLGELLGDHFAGARGAHNTLLADSARIDRILAEGARKARPLARSLMARVREAVGAGPLPS